MANKMKDVIGKIDIWDARILWNYKEGDLSRITDLIVVEFKLGKDSEWPMELYDKYTSDMGNCNAAWDCVTNEYLFYKFFVKHSYENDKERLKAFLEFMKIRQIAEQVKKIEPGIHYYSEE